MLRERKLYRTIGYIIVLTLIINAGLIIPVIIYDTELYWILLLTAPLSVLAIYRLGRARFFPETFNRIWKPGGQTMRERLVVLRRSDFINETDLKVQIGNDQCSQPYTSDIVNIELARKGKIDSMLDYTSRKTAPDYFPANEGWEMYRLAGTDLACQVKLDHLISGNLAGRTNKLKQVASLPQVRTLELTISSQIKGAYSTDSSLHTLSRTFSKITDNVFPHSWFGQPRDAEGIIHHMENLRELSAGKPIGIRLRVTEKKDFQAICHAICKTQFFPDFIVVEGELENTYIKKKDQCFHQSMHLYEALLFVSQTLKNYRLHQNVKVIAAGKFLSGWDILKALAVGASAVYKQISFVENGKYSTTGYNTSIPEQGLDRNFIRENYISATVQAMRKCGFMTVNDITLSNLLCRLSFPHAENGDKSGHVVSPLYLRKEFNRSTHTFQGELMPTSAFKSATVE